MTPDCGEVNVLEGSAAIQGDLDRNRPTGALTRTNDESFPERQSPAAIQRPGISSGGQQAASGPALCTKTAMRASST